MHSHKMTVDTPVILIVPIFLPIARPHMYLSTQPELMLISPIVIEA